MWQAIKCFFGFHDWELTIEDNYPDLEYKEWRCCHCYHWCNEIWIDEEDDDC